MMPADQASEETILKKIKAKVIVPRGSIVTTGIGDDCAIVRQKGASADLLFTTDLFVENVHFQRDACPARDAGYRALARGLSDIAAMGGEPHFCLVSLAAAPWTTAAWISRFYDGLLTLAGSTGTALAGGDLGHADVFVCDVVVGGSVPRGKALLRSGARPGDTVYVSGALGGSALGLESGRGKAWRRHLRPEPRLALGAALRNRATACMDLSDGLSLDLRRMCLSSGVSAEIEPPPRFPGASLDQALHGGEDYELLFTARKPLPLEIEGVCISPIGRIRRGIPGAVLLEGQPLSPKGYDHFAAS